MVIIAISGSVGSGKTSIASMLSKKLGFRVLHLGELAEKYKVADIPELMTMDFDLDKLLLDLEKKILEFRNNGENVILEGHFSHFINPELIDFLFILNRNLKDLRAEYIRRGYLEIKISDNLEVESFNLCYFEALEGGYDLEKIFCIENIGEIDSLLFKILKIIEGKQ